MATPKQIAANRRNAQQSTGPRTPSGKSKVRLNALKHGLTAQSVLLPFEDAAAYEALQQAVLQDLQPQNTTQQILVERFVHRHWISQRLARTERGWLHAMYEAHLADGLRKATHAKANPDPYQGLALCMLQAHPDDTQDLLHKNFFRYRAQIEHDFQRALRALERNQLLTTPSEESENPEIGFVSQSGSPAQGSGQNAGGVASDSGSAGGASGGAGAGPGTGSGSGEGSAGGSGAGSGDGAGAGSGVGAGAGSGVGAGAGSAGGSGVGAGDGAGDGVGVGSGSGSGSGAGGSGAT